MNREDINSKASQLLGRFDMMESIAPSGNWEYELFSKLTAKQRPHATKLNQIKATVVVIFFLLINGFVFLQSSYSERITSERQEVLQNISAHLLINSTASN